MPSPVLTTIALTGFTVAFFHAAIPTHWLPFVLVSRARGWSRAKTLLVTVFAGLGHVALTTLLGLGLAWFGFKLDQRFGEAFPKIAGALLLAVGAYYFWRQWRGAGICHHPVPGGHHHADEHCGHEDEEHSHWDGELKDSELLSMKKGDWAAISGLFLMLTLSPCEAFLPIYLSGVPFGWTGFFTLSAILAAATFAGMLVFTWLALVGLEKIQVKKFERYEAALLGGLFSIVGVLIMVLEH
jgi:ABC-type nickel/cobalt efflux system permease component RcnA